MTTRSGELVALSCIIRLDCGSDGVKASAHTATPVHARGDYRAARGTQDASCASCPPPLGVIQTATAAGALLYLDNGAEKAMAATAPLCGQGWMPRHDRAASGWAGLTFPRRVVAVSCPPELEELKVYSILKDFVKNEAKFIRLQVAYEIHLLPLTHLDRRAADLSHLHLRRRRRCSHHHLAPSQWATATTGKRRRTSRCAQAATTTGPSSLSCMRPVRAQSRRLVRCRRVVVTN